MDAIAAYGYDIIRLVNSQPLRSVNLQHQRIDEVNARFVYRSDDRSDVRSDSRSGDRSDDCSDDRSDDGSDDRSDESCLNGRIPITPANFRSKMEKAIFTHRISQV